MLELDEGLLFVSMRVLDVRRRSSVTLAVDQSASGALGQWQSLRPSCPVDNRAPVASRILAPGPEPVDAAPFCSPRQEKTGATAHSSVECSRWSLLWVRRRPSHRYQQDGGVCAGRRGAGAFRARQQLDLRGRAHPVGRHVHLRGPVKRAHPAPRWGVTFQHAPPETLPFMPCSPLRVLYSPLPCWRWLQVVLKQHGLEARKIIIPLCHWLWLFRSWLRGPNAGLVSLPRVTDPERRRAGAQG